MARKIKPAGHRASTARPTPPGPSTIQRPERPAGRAIAGDPGPGRAQGQAGAGRAAGVRQAVALTKPTGHLPAPTRGPVKGKAARAQGRLK